MGSGGECNGLRRRNAKDDVSFHVRCKAGDVKRRACVGFRRRNAKDDVRCEWASCEAKLGCDGEAMIREFNGIMCEALLPTLA